jgi:phage tail sheath protein FI
MSEPTFGISIQRIDNEPRPAVWSDMSVVGLIGTAPLANGTTFPLNTPVFMYSDDATMAAALGATGTLPDAIEGINDQLGEFQVAAKVVVVRIAEGADVDETIENIVGSSLSKTGIHAFMEAGPALGIIPRLIAAPGFTGQHDTGVQGLTIANAGDDYTDGTHAITATGGGGTGFAGTATVVDGSITEVEITDPGSGYTSAPSIVLTALGAGSGGSITATVGALANPVCAELPSVLNKLLAVAVVDGPATTQAAFTAWRETMQSERLIPVETAVKVGVNATVKPASPRVLGIAVRRDHEYQGRPFHSWANQPVQGIVGPSRNINFSLVDGATEGQTILSQNGGIIIRGEMGVETAIASGGFVYVGTDTCSEDTLWQFYNVVRGRDYIHLMFLRTLRFYLGRFNITGQTIEAIRNTMAFAMRDLKADGDILGYRVAFTRDQNSPEQLRMGKFTVNFAAEEPPVLRYLGIQSARYRPALDALLDDLLSQLDAVTG